MCILQGGLLSSCRCTFASESGCNMHGLIPVFEGTLYFNEKFAMAVTGSYCISRCTKEMMLIIKHETRFLQLQVKMAALTITLIVCNCLCLMLPSPGNSWGIERGEITCIFSKSVLLAGSSSCSIKLLGQQKLLFFQVAFLSRKVSHFATLLSAQHISCHQRKFSKNKFLQPF